MADKGTAEIASKFKKIIKTRIKVIALKITIPIVAIIVILAGFDWQNNKSTTEALQAGIYANALDEGQTDLSQLVEIKGDDSTGYYLEFVSDIDERLERVINADKEKYSALGLTLKEGHKDDGVATLKKFLKAQISTEFPHLGARMSGGGSGGATGSIDSTPDLSNTTFYPRDVQQGWCQWYAIGRVREVYGIDIPSGNYLQMGSLKSSYGGRCFQDEFCKDYHEYFELSEEPAPGSIYCGRNKDHVGFIKSVDRDAGTITIEDGNSLPWGDGTFINWTSEYGITNRQNGNAGLAIHTMTIDAFKEYWNPIFCVPTEKARELMKDANITDVPSTTGNVDSLEGILFIGDSITAFLENSHEITDEGVQFRGVGSSSPSHWLNDKAVGGKQTFSSLPDDSDSITAICIMLGTNGLNNTNAESQANTMQQVIEKVHDKYPDKTMYVQKLYPFTSQWNGEYVEAGVENYNAKLEEICNSLGYTVLIDSTANIELGDGLHPSPEGCKTLADNTREQIIMSAKSGGKTVSNPNAFQGSIRIRRVGPNKGVGEYKKLDQENIIQENIENEGNTGEGLGKKEDIPEAVKKKIIGNTVPEDKQEVLNDMAYLTIPYVNFDDVVKEGHMIVNKNIADDVLNLFQDLYNIKYPIEKMEIIDSYKKSDESDKDVEYQAIDDNNTYSFCYLSEDENSTGNIITINPQINPKLINGDPGHNNAIKYSNREEEKMRHWRQEEKDACIEKGSEAYEIFTKYGFVWGGENSENPNYMDFKKIVVTSGETQKTVVDTRIYDLSYVPEETFNKYVEENNSRALRVYTLDENKKLTIASWSYTTDGGLKISKGNTINYKASLGKYSMPVEYLLAILQYSEDKAFTEGMADLAINSEYIIAVEDSVRTTQTVTKTQKDSMNVYTETGETVITSSSSTEDKKISETSSQKVEVTYVDCWFVKYAKDFSFNLQTSISNGTGNEISLSGEPGEKIGDFKITAYCSCATCCGTSTGITASGAKVQAGLTIAVDPNVIPLGEYVSFNDHIYHAEDTGGAIKGNHIDLYMNSHQDAQNWGTRTMPVYWAKDVSEEDTETTTTYVNKNPITTTAKIMAEVKNSHSENSTTTTETIQGPFKPDEEKGKYYSNLRTTTTIITDSSSINYDTGEEKISGNAQKFIDLYNRKEFKKMRQNIYVSWLVESLEDNEKTSILCEVTEYLFSRASKKNYKTNTLKFEEYKPGQFYQYRPSSGGGISQLRRYINYMEGSTGLSEDGTKYIVGTDGFGNVAVGHGIDIRNGGFANRIIEAGYSISVGSEIPVEFIDGLEDEVLENLLSEVEKYCGDLNLKQYQKYALVSRSYNCGLTGAGVANGLFRESYNRYWNQETDDEYKVEWNDGMYNHPLYNGLMSGPATAGGVVAGGLVKRRQSEWILFKTGHYLFDYGDGGINEWFSATEGGEFLQTAKSVWAKVCEQQPSYSMAFSKKVPPEEPLQYVDCSHYVTWVLYEYGYKEFEGNQQSTYSLIGTNWNEKYDWEEIAIGDGDISSQLQSGDILVRDGHTCIVVDTSGGKIMAYDCGSGTNQTGPSTWAGRWSEVKGTDDPVDSTYFATGNYGAGKIIRVTPPQ